MTAAGASQRVRAHGDEHGVALVIALLASLLLTVLGIALIVVADTETRIAATFRDGQEALYAADAGVERAALDLVDLARWDDALSGRARSSFFDSTLTPTLPGGGASLDLVAETGALQRATDGDSLWGPNTPRWRLYASGPLDRLLPSGPPRSRLYIAVWVADDPSEADGDPGADTNRVLVLRAAAFGQAGTRKVVEVTVGQGESPEPEGGGPLARFFSWREIR